MSAWCAEPLAGIEGTLIRSGSQSKLVISIEMIQRSVAASVAESDVEPVLTPSPAAAGIRIGGRPGLLQQRRLTESQKSPLVPTQGDVNRLLFRN